MGLRLRNPALQGSIELIAATTASNFTVTAPAATGVMLPADSNTGGAYFPVGTTAQRPTGTAGQARFNTTTSRMEYYNGSAWISF